MSLILCSGGDGNAGRNRAQDGQLRHLDCEAVCPHTPERGAVLSAPVRQECIAGQAVHERLIRQNRGVTNLEIEKTGIKDFDRCAKRYHIDYAIQKDLSCTPPRFLIFFKAQDADALNAAFKEYSAAVLNKAERPSVLAKLHDLAQVIANLPDKVRHKEEERGL